MERKRTSPYNDPITLCALCTYMYICELLGLGLGLGLGSGLGRLPHVVDAHEVVGVRAVHAGLVRHALVRPLSVHQDGGRVELVDVQGGELPEVDVVGLPVLVPGSSCHACGG